MNKQDELLGKMVREIYEAGQGWRLSYCDTVEELIVEYGFMLDSNDCAEE